MKNEKKSPSALTKHENTKKKNPVRHCGKLARGRAKNAVVCVYAVNPTKKNPPEKYFVSYARRLGNE